MAHAGWRRVAAATLIAYLAFLGWILLWPSAGPVSTFVDRLLDLLWGAGWSTQLVTPVRVEFVLNAVMLVPVPVLATLAGARWRWERWTAVVFLVAGIVEVLQALVLPDRSAQFQDIVSNTLGVLIGALMCTPLVRTRGRRRRSGPA